MQIEKWKKHKKKGCREPYRISQKTRKTAKKGYRIPIAPRKSTSLLKTPSKNSPKTLKKCVFPQIRTESGRPKLRFSPKIYVKKMKKTAKNTKTVKFGKTIPIGGPKSKFYKKKREKKHQKLVIFRLFWKSILELHGWLTNFREKRHHNFLKKVRKTRFFGKKVSFFEKTAKTGSEKSRKNQPKILSA